MVKENKNETHSDGREYDFNEFRGLKQFGNDIYTGDISIEDAKDEQFKMDNSLKSSRKILSNK